MKRCPQCGAEYDDYVQYCFVDGAELAAAPVGEPAAPPPPKPAPRATTPVPAGGIPPRAAAGPPRHAPPPPPEPARASTLWALLVLMLLGGTLFAFVGLGVALLYFGNRDDAQPVVERPVPPPPPALPPPSPTARPTSVLRVRFESTPPGAAVWEADRFLCTTPCDVEHPDYAPPQRTFVLKLDGFGDTEYVLTDPTVVQQVPLRADGNHVTRPVRPRPTDEILIQR